MKTTQTSLSVIDTCLIALGAVASVVFLFLIEAYNSPVLDDLGFITTLNDTTIFGYALQEWQTWEGRYMSFLEHGVQYRAYELFGSTIPYSMLLYAIEIALLQSAIRMVTPISRGKAVVYSVWVWGLFVVCLPDFASYYWMCTKAYPLLIALTVWLLAKIYFSCSHRWYDYLAVVVVACFVGCSTEVFAPMILVLMGIRVLRKWKQCEWSIPALFRKEGVLCVAFLVAAANFFVMVFSPGTFVRMGAVADKEPLSLLGYVSGLVSGSVQICKMMFFKLHYYVAFFAVALFVLMTFTDKESALPMKTVWLRFVRNMLITIGLFLLSMVLCLFATQEPFISRAMAHLPMAVFLLLFLLAKDLAQTDCFQKQAARTVVLVLTCAGSLFVLCDSIYSTARAYPELEAYEATRLAREERLQQLETAGNTETVFIEPLRTPEYHSLMDDMWRLIMPKYSRRALLRTDEVGDTVDFYYNVEFRKYYHLSFDVISDIVWVGV